MSSWKMTVKVNKRSGQGGMSNLIQKNSKIFAISEENWPEKTGRKTQQANQMNGVPSITAKTLAFPSPL